MSYFELILFGMGLSIDTFAVSVSTGLIVENIRFLQAVRFALILALFQTMMPALGIVAGREMLEIAKDYDHWIAFILLGILGAKMIIDSLSDDKQAENKLNPLHPVTASGIALATSIDALVVGFTFGLLNVELVEAVGIFGSTTFLFAMLGMLLGKKISSRFDKKAVMAGGLVLICLGVKILIEHLG